MANPVEVLTLPASELGTYSIDDIEFLDSQEPPQVITPNTDTVTYCLTDSAGNVQNDIKDKALASAASMTITLSGDDLSVSGTPDKIITRDGFLVKIYQRRLAVRGEINSTLGNNLPSTKEFAFNIENIVCL